MSQEKVVIFPPSCPHCRTVGATQCQFDANAHAFAADEKMTPEEIQLSIAQARIIARDRMCPYLNYIDPDYPGREHL